MSADHRDKKRLVAFFRNDDVNELTAEPIELTSLMVGEEVPIVHAVQPGDVSDDTRT